LSPRLAQQQQQPNTNTRSNPEPPSSCLQVGRDYGSDEAAHRSHLPYALLEAEGLLCVLRCCDKVDRRLRQILALLGGSEHVSSRGACSRGGAYDLVVHGGVALSLGHLGLVGVEQQWRMRCESAPKWLQSITCLAFLQQHNQHHLVGGGHRGDEQVQKDGCPPYVCVNG